MNLPSLQYKGVKRPDSSSSCSPLGGLFSTILYANGSFLNGIVSLLSIELIGLEAWLSIYELVRIYYLGLVFLLFCDYLTLVKF